MGVAVRQAESLSLEQIECFLDGCQAVAFEAGTRTNKYALVEGDLKRHHYADQKRSVKGLLRHFPSKLTGVSRAQLTRLIGQFPRERCVHPTAYRRRCFPTERPDRRGKLRKVYAEWSTPLEKLLSLPAAQRGLRADRSIERLQARADA